MVFYLVTVGRLKDGAIRDACLDYFTRVQRYVKLELVEVRDGGRRDNRAALAREEEGRALLKAIPASAQVVALTRVGKAETSLQFAGRLREWRDRGLDVAFVIGGAHGLDEELLKRANHRLSLSSWTLPHELARLTLLEQLYRACTILRGEPYHKGG
ncbi:23S rRNA (pseudouridine(1915)-N(3))-methyltransferase RlmH [Gemmatimonadota bacterium]